MHSLESPAVLNEAIGPLTATMTVNCQRCDERFGFFEAHSRLPSDFGSSPHACGAPAMPCPDRNTEKPLKMPPRFIVNEDGSRQ